MEPSANLGGISFHLPPEDKGTHDSRLDWCKTSLATLTITVGLIRKEHESNKTNFGINKNIISLSQQISQLNGEYATVKDTSNIDEKTFDEKAGHIESEITRLSNEVNILYKKVQDAPKRTPGALPS